MNKRKGFALIELFVVLAIIALLAATLLPALKHARQEAQSRNGIISTEKGVVGGPPTSVNSETAGPQSSSNSRLTIVYSHFSATVYKDNTTGKEYLSVDNAGTCLMQP